MPKVYQDIHEGAHADVVVRILHAFGYPLSEGSELPIHSLILFEDVADMIHLR